MRTRYVKISISKSGQSAKELSERHHEINNTFTFLDSHVKRGSSLQSFNVKLQSEKGVEDEEESATSTETFPAEISVGQMPQLHSSGEQSQSHQSLIGTFMARAGKIEELRKSLTSQNVEKKPQDEAADLFVAYLSNQLHQVSPNNWPDFTVDATRLVESCTLRNLHSVYELPFALNSILYASSKWARLFYATKSFLKYIQATIK